MLVASATGILFVSANRVQSDTIALQEVVVTGTRNAVDVRHLPYTVNVISRNKKNARSRSHEH